MCYSPVHARLGGAKLYSIVYHVFTNTIAPYAFSKTRTSRNVRLNTFHCVTTLWMNVCARGLHTNSITECNTLMLFFLYFRNSGQECITKLVVSRNVKRSYSTGNLSVWQQCDLPTSCWEKKMPRMQQDAFKRVTKSSICMTDCLIPCLPLSVNVTKPLM